MIAVNLGPSRLQSIVAGEMSREPVGLSPSVFTIRGQGKVSWVPSPMDDSLRWRGAGSLARKLVSGRVAGNGELPHHLDRRATITRKPHQTLPHRRI